MFEYLDQYCERLAPGLFGEPLNLISNLAFPLGALWAARYLKNIPAEKKIKDIEILLSMIFVIGLGSSLFHSFANGWSQLADQIPIGIFILSFLGVFLKRVVGFPLWGALLGVGSYFVINPVIKKLAQNLPLNGSQVYLTAFFMLLVFTGVLIAQKKEAYKWFLGASGVFILSLTFRSIDQLVCPSFSYGTHFLWHISNGIMLAFLMRGLIQAISG